VGAMNHLRSKIIIVPLLVLLSLVLAGSASSSVPTGMLVQIKNMSFRPDRISFPGDGFAVVVVQNREDAPILHEVYSRELLRRERSFQSKGQKRLNTTINGFLEHCSTRERKW
jgi:hypothetical protein